jgi:hypothetical protein
VRVSDNRGTLHMDCCFRSLAPGASFVLVAAVSTSGPEVDSTLATLNAAREIQNTAVVHPTRMPKLSQHEMATHLLKMCTVRLRRHLMQHSAQHIYPFQAFIL